MPVTDESGYTLIELLIGALVSLIVLGAIMTIVIAATRQQDRTAEQVAANQRARPAMTRIIDRLHSACVSPGLAPVQQGSTGSTMILLSQTGDAVSPTPNRYVISLDDGVLSEVAYPASGGEAPKWTFSETPSSTFQLVDGVTTASVGDPPSSVPVFRYYAYEDREVANQPLDTPLSEANAAITVQVDVAFTVTPSGGSAGDDGGPIAITDAATLRIEPASEDSAEVNRPCV